MSDASDFAPSLQLPADDSLRVIPLGGLGEVGMNLMLYQSCGRILVVDCGLLFPDDEQHPGVQYLIPRLDYLRANAGRVEAIFLTHGHEDHVGALPHLLGEIDAPVYATPLTLGLVRLKLAEWGLEKKARLETIEPGGRYRAGPFEVEPVAVTHSIVDAVAFAITTPQGVIFHTGDFKIDPTPMGSQWIDLDRIAEIGRQGVLALLSDSTNVEREGHTPSERSIRGAFEEIFASHRGRIILATFSSNIDRIQQVLDVAAASKRKVVLCGRSIERTVRLARELGYLSPPRGVLAPHRQMGKLAPEALCIVTTGTQGEPFSALSRMASARHRSITVGAGDLVVLSSRTIPGNERAISRTLNGLYSLGARVIYERVSEVHVSGHASQDEQRQMIELTRPRHFIAVHGEVRHLVRHGRLAAQAGIPRERVWAIQDGAVLNLRESEVFLEARVPAGPVAVDRGVPTLLAQELITERHYMGANGVLVATLHVDPDRGKLLGEPRFERRGLAPNGHGDSALARVVTEGVFEYYGGEGRDHDSIEECLIAALRRAYRRKSATVPFVVPVVICGES